MPACPVSALWPPEVVVVSVCSVVRGHTESTVHTGARIRAASIGKVGYEILYVIQSGVGRYTCFACER